MSKNEGGFIVPDHIAIWLDRWRLLQLLSDLAGDGKCYYFDNQGLRYVKGDS